MTLHSWIRKLFVRPVTRPTRQAPARRRPTLEALEDRLVPSTFTVLNTSDSGAGSLRQAILDANAYPGADVINFDPAAFSTPSTIRLLSSLPDITGDLTINGPTAARLTISGDANNSGANDDGDVRILSVSAGDVTLSYLTLTNGRARGADGADEFGFFVDGGDGGDGEGGAIFVGGGAVTLNNSTLANNTAQGGRGGFAFVGGGGDGGDGEGGAIYVAAGAVTLNNSTLANNTAQGGRGGLGSPSPFGEWDPVGEDGDGRGGAIYVNGGASATLLNSTLSRNAAQSGGGLFSDGTVTLNNTIVHGNTLSDGTTPSDLAGGADVTAASSHNLIGPGGAGGLADGVNGNIVVADAAALGLGALGDYGGLTQTVPLLSGSPAIDAADPSLAPAADQRGFARDALPDIGAFEAQRPTLTRGVAAVTVNEGSPATNTGTFDDADGRGTVTLTVSLGTVTKDAAAGTWSWSYTPPDGPSGPTTVTITATGASGLEATTTFTLTVNNVAPTASITGAPASGHRPEGTAIALGSSVTDPSSVDTAAGFTYAWSVTKNGAAYASGSAASFTFTPDDNGTYVVTLTVTDKDGGVSPPATATILVDNVAPTAGLSGPTDGVRGQARTFTLTATDPSSVDQAAGFTFAIAWGDGATQTVTGPSGTAVSHVYTASGTYTVQVTATDKDGGTGAAATVTDMITAVALETDPSDPSKTALFIGGTTGADTITIKPADAAGTLDVKIGTTDLGNFKPTGHLIVYGQASDDTIKLQTAAINGKTVYVTAPAFLFGDDDNDTLNTQGSTANNVLVGGAGNDTLQAGSGRDLLIGGTGADVLHGDGGDDILIGGTTDYDSNLTALNAIMAEWGRTDADYATRVKHLSGALSGGLNGSTLLKAGTGGTVHDDAAIDTLFGEGGSDWFFALLSGTNKDVVKDQATGEVVTGL
jgi:Ca2+-binding RTX toxin-like protein